MGDPWKPKKGFKPWLKDNAFKRISTWGNVSRWIYGINSGSETPSYNEAFKECKSILRRKKELSGIAVINVRKIAGGTTANDTRVYEDFKDKFQEIVSKQIKLYVDNGCKIIICCSDVVWKCVEDISQEVFGVELSSLEKIKFSIRTTHGKSVNKHLVKIPDGGPIIVNFLHPQQQGHYKNEDLYSSLVTAVKNAL